MTSKEALKELIDNAQDMSEWELVRLNIVKKDLEVLEILKRSIFNKEIHKYTLDEKLKGQKFMTIDISIRGDDINEIKEWLENGQRKNDRNLQ